MRRLALVISVLLVASCAPTPPPDTARVKADAFDTNADVDIYSANLAQWAFADPPGRTRKDPVDALRSAAALDYLAGQLSSSPRWTFVSPLTKDLLLNARQEVRGQIGVAPGAKSQAVVNALLASANALAANDQALAVKALDVPAFSQAGEVTFTKVVNMPYMQNTNFAVQSAASQMQQMSPRDCIWCM